MTITELRETLQQFEAQGKGALRIAVADRDFDDSFLSIPFAPEILYARRNFGDHIDDGEVLYLGVIDFDRPAPREV